MMLNSQQAKEPPLMTPPPLDSNGVGAALPSHHYIEPYSYLAPQRDDEAPMIRVGHEYQAVIPQLEPVETGNACKPRLLMRHIQSDAQ